MGRFFLSHSIGLWRERRATARSARNFCPQIERLEDRLLLSSTPAGAAFVVNSLTSSSHVDAAVATSSVGQSIIVWSSQNQAGSSSGYDIYATRYDVNGNALDVPGQPAGTKEFLVNTGFTTNDQDHAAVAMASDGSFVVTWDSIGQPSGTLASVWAQRYDASGNALGTAFLVNASASNSRSTPSIAMNGAGQFVIAWRSFNEEGSGTNIASTDGVYAQIFNANGSRVGSEFKVNTTVLFAQNTPNVAIDATGDFVVVWQSSAADGSTFDIFGQRYNASGVAQGGEFQINQYTTSNQRNAEVAMDNAGDFVVTWRSTGQDGSSDGVYARRYNAAGVAQGNEFRVNTYTSSNQQFADVGMDASGNFTIVWQSSGQNGVGTGIFSIFEQSYTASGATIGGETQVYAVVGQSQTLPALGMDQNGGMMLAWQSVRSDLISSDIRAQRFTPDATADVYTTSVGQPLTTTAATGVLSNDTLLTQPLSVTLVTSAAHGSLQLNANGSFTYTPSANFAGVDTFTYRALAGQENSSVTTVTINVIDQAALNTISARLYNDALSGASSAPAKVQGLLNLMNADGSFQGYDYSGVTDQSGTDYDRHAENLTTLAQAYQYNNAGNVWYQSAALLAKITTSFNYLATTAVGDANVPNWYDTQIATSNDLWPAMILLQSQLGSTLIGTMLTKYFDNASRPVWDATATDGKNAGSNLTLRADAAVAEGALRNDATYFNTRLSQVVSLVSNDLAGGSATGDGLQADDSEHQHSMLTPAAGQMQSGSYGVDYATSLAKLLPWLANTSYAFSSTTDNEVVGYLLDGEQWLARGAAFEPTSLGRSITRPGDVITTETAHLQTAATGLLALGIRTTELQSLIDRVTNGSTATNYLSGNRAFWTSDEMVQQRQGYFASVRMISSRTIRPETLNGEGLQSFYLGDGVTTLYVDGKEYGTTKGQEIFPVWNWQRLPGTTVEQMATIPTSLTEDGTPDTATLNQYIGLGSFVGEVSNGTNGLAAMNYARAAVTVTAHKSYFYFDEGFVALGAAINDTNAANPVYTTLDQTLLDGNITVEKSDGSQTTFGAGTTMNLSDPRWILHDGVGYLLLGDNGNVTVQSQSQTGTWQSIGVSTGSVTQNVFTAYINHGVAPQNAGYAYAVLPGATASSLDTYASSNSPISVLSNTSAIQAVRENAQGLTEIAFFQPGTLSISPSLSITVDQACLVMIRELTDGSLEVSVSDPTQSLSQVHVSINQHLNGTGVAWSSSQGISQITFNLPGGAMAGQSVVESFAVDSAPQVLGIYVAGSTWDSSYFDYLDSTGHGNATVAGLGYAIPTDSHQLDTLPWLGLNTLNIQFSENVNVSQSSLSLIGSSDAGVPALPAVSNFAYDSASHVATWTFATPLKFNRDLVILDSATITDAGGAQLDGDGTGSPGSDFNFMIYVLPGDQLNQQTVTLADAKQIVPYINRSAGDAGYNYRMDVLGQGTITLADAKQIVPHINDDISGLSDPNAPAQSNAAQVHDSAAFTTFADNDLVSSADGIPQTPVAAVNDVLALVVSPPLSSTSDAISLQPPLPSDRALAVDYLFAGSTEWLDATVLPPLHVESNQNIPFTPAPVASTPTLVVSPPTAVILSNRIPIGIGAPDDSADETTDFVVDRNVETEIVASKPLPAGPPESPV